MRKRYLFTVVVLGILLLCGGIIGYGILCRVNTKKEMMQKMAEQKIVFICTMRAYSDYFELLGYFIDNSGDKYFFDVSDEFRKRPLDEHNNDNVYEYLCDHMEEYEKMPFLQEDRLYDCYANLNLIDKDAEMVGKYMLVDFGALRLYGIRLSESGEREFILLEETGDWQGYNSDEYAQRIVEIIGNDTWKYYTKEQYEHWGDICEDDGNYIRIY